MRKLAFGRNDKKVIKMPNFLDSLKEYSKDKLWLIIYGSSVVLCLFEGIFIGPEAILQGLSIILGATVIILISAMIDYSKDKQFVSI